MAADCTDGLQLTRSTHMKLMRSGVHTRPQLIITRPCTFRLTCLPRKQNPLRALLTRPSGSRQTLKVAAMAAVAPSVRRFEFAEIFKILTGS